MGLLQMSLSGAVLIVAVIMIRALAINRLPKRTFLILWGVVLLRLLVPFSVPSAFSVYSLLAQNTDFDMFAQHAAEQIDSIDAPDSQQLADITHITNTAHNERKQPQDIAAVRNDDTDIVRTPMYREKGKTHKAVWMMIWCVGMIVCMIYFTVSYLHCRAGFQASLPVTNTVVQGFLNDSSHWRRISVRQSDQVTTPLTYGIFYPVILMPKSTDWGDTEQLQYILMHEYVHICRCDALTKLLVVCALCIHWFNPMVWIMYVLFNRDVEISCDECVVRRMGEMSKATYAKMLIQMEAERSGLVPFCNSFLFKLGKNAMEERITAIMKIRKKSMLAGIVAAVLVISMTTAFATSATENSKETETSEKINENSITEQDYDKLRALQIDGYEDLSISEFQDRIWTLTDTEEYNHLLERFFADETLYTMYEHDKETDSDEIVSFLYNILAPLMVDAQQLPRSFGGCAVSDFSGASDNASVEYFVTLKILDADFLTVRDYDWARQSVVRDLGDILKDLSTSELRDEEHMKVYIDETIENIIKMYENDMLRITIEYQYTPLGEMAVDDMEDWQKERQKEWDRLMTPYIPFGLTYSYDWDTDDYKMYFQGKEVRGIYDEGENFYISEHIGIGRGIYDENAIELFAVYENGKLAGLREATAQEMAESSQRRQAITDLNEEDKRAGYLREALPATEEDYQSLLVLETSDYQLKSIAEFDRELLDWANENYERMERIRCDQGWNDYHVALTEEEKSFVVLTTWLSQMENAEYVRSIQKNEPEQDICVDINLSDREETAADSNASAWCSLWYSFSYHISDKEKVSVGKRDDQIRKMTDEIQAWWESTDINELVKMTESDILELLRAKAAKYSSQEISITIRDDQVSFECMDERFE